MSKYSSKYMGDKLYSYVAYEEYLLQKLIKKIHRKYHSDKQFDKHYYAFSKGYYTSNGFNKKYNPFKEAYVVENELYEDSYFYDGVLTYSMLPCIYFDFPYVTETLYPYMKVDVSPSDVTDRLMNVAMVKNNPIVIEDLLHSNNMRFFRVVIPLSYYSVRKEFYYENKQFKKVVNFEKRQEN